MHRSDLTGVLNASTWSEVALAWPCWCHRAETVPYSTHNIADITVNQEALKRKNISLIMSKNLERQDSKFLTTDILEST